MYSIMYMYDICTMYHCIPMKIFHEHIPLMFVKVESKKYCVCKIPMIRGSQIVAKILHYWQPFYPLVI